MGGAIFIETLDEILEKSFTEALDKEEVSIETKQEAPVAE